jgi:hypothetical protein
MEDRRGGITERTCKLLGEDKSRSTKHRIACSPFPSGSLLVDGHAGHVTSQQAGLACGRHCGCGWAFLRVRMEHGPYEVLQPSSPVGQHVLFTLHLRCSRMAIAAHASTVAHVELTSHAALLHYMPPVESASSCTFSWCGVRRLPSCEAHSRRPGDERYGADCLCCIHDVCLKLSIVRKTCTLCCASQPAFCL